MNNKIKITAEYEIPETTKFDLLMAEYRAAKKYADETVAYYQPLADAAEEAKFDAIMTQLEAIVKYAQQISQITKRYVRLVASPPSGPRYFQIEYSPDKGSKIKWGSMIFSKDNLQKYPVSFTSEYEYGNILGNWEKWKIYEQLEQEALEELHNIIDSELSRAENQIKRLNNIIKGGETK